MDNSDHYSAMNHSLAYLLSQTIDDRRGRSPRSHFSEEVSEFLEANNCSDMIDEAGDVLFTMVKCIEEAAGPDFNRGQILLMVLDANCDKAARIAADSLILNSQIGDNNELN